VLLYDEVWCREVKLHTFFTLSEEKRPWHALGGALTRSGRCREEKISCALQRIELVLLALIWLSYPGSWLVTENVPKLWTENKSRNILLPSSSSRINILLNSVRQHSHFITQGNYKATCFDCRFSSSGLFRQLCHEMLCTLWDPKVFTFMEYIKSDVFHGIHQIWCIPWNTSNLMYSMSRLECVYTCLTQLYVGRDMYNLLHKINYMFRLFSLAIFRLIIEKHLVSSYTWLMWVFIYSGRGGEVWVGNEISHVV